MTADTMSFGGFRVRNTRTPAMMRFIRRRMAQNRKIAIGFANHHFVTACQVLSCDLQQKQDFVLLNDGIGMEIAARLRFGHGFLENMNGTDFVPRLLREPGAEPHRVYLVGGHRDVLRRTAETIANIPGCRVVGFCDGYSLWHHQDDVIREIGSVAPDILLVGLGNPIQERWIVENWTRLDAKVVIGVGALFEWMTGSKRRAPFLVRRFRLEWAYRVVIEPRRLLRRYTIDALRFAMLVFRSDRRLVVPDA